jgi:hypothetical protein
MEEKRELTEKQTLFLDALMTEEVKGNIKKAMKIAGYAETTHSKVVVSALKDEINERAALVMAMNAPKAAWSMVDVLDDPSAMGARNSIAAAAQLLDRTGLIKKEQVEVKNTGGAMFILPPKSED